MLLPAVWQNNKRKSSAPSLEAKRKRIQHDEEREERAIDEIACIIDHALQGQPAGEGAAAQLAAVAALRIDVHSILNDIPFERLLCNIATRDVVRAAACGCGCVRVRLCVLRVRARAGAAAARAAARLTAARADARRAHRDARVRGALHAREHVERREGLHDGRGVRVHDDRRGAAVRVHAVRDPEHLERAPGHVCAVPAQDDAAAVLQDNLQRRQREHADPEVRQHLQPARRVPPVGDADLPGERAGAHDAGCVRLCVVSVRALVCCLLCVASAAAADTLDPAVPIMSHQRNRYAVDTISGVKHLRQLKVGVQDFQ